MPQDIKQRARKLRTDNHWSVDGLVGYWDMAEGSGNLIRDLSGNGNHGTINGATWTPTDEPRHSPALDFDGIDNYLDVGANPSYENDSRGSICAWIRPDTLLGADGVKEIYCAAAGSSDRLLAFDIRRRDAVASGVTRLDITHKDTVPSVDGIMGSTDLVAGIWYFVCVVSNGSSYELYLQGREESLNVWLGSNSGDWFAEAATLNYHWIGASNYSGSRADEFDGFIDEVRIYNRALSTAEVWQLYVASAIRRGVYVLLFAEAAAANDLLLLHQINLRGGLQELRGGLM